MNSQIVQIQNYLSNLLQEPTSNTFSHTLVDFIKQTCALLHDLHKHDIVASSLENGNWYRFDGKFWVKEHSDKIIEYLIDILNEIRKGIDIEFEEKCIELFGNIIDAEEFDVLKHLTEIFYDNQLCSKLDSRPNLVGFENGVYDYAVNDFREHRIDDYLSLSTRTVYTANLSAQIKELLSPNAHEVFYSVENTDAIDVIRQQLGDYFVEVDSYYFCENRFVGSFMDSFPRKLVGRKFVYVPCPLQKPLHASVIKMVSGHDTLLTFIPGKSMVCVVFHGRLCFQGKLSLDHEDAGLLRRYRELPEISLRVPEYA